MQEFLDARRVWQMKEEQISCGRTLVAELLDSFSHLLLLSLRAHQGRGLVGAYPFSRLPVPSLASRRRT